MTENIQFYSVAYDALPPEISAQLSELTQQIFDMPLNKEKVNGKGACIVTYAIKDHAILGYKIGYPENDKRFYSWLGCVSPAARGKGVGRSLMDAQHQYCRKAGFTHVTTKTMNKWRNMLLLNIKSGFDVTGVSQDTKGELKIHLAKAL